MTPRPFVPRLAACVVAALVAVACGSPGAAPGPTSSSRPPLGDPPDPGPVPLETGLDPEMLATLVAESTVRIVGPSCGRTQEGSGFAVADDVVATNAHVVATLDEIHVTTLDGRDLPGEVVAIDLVDDLALVRVPGAGFTPLELATDEDVPDGTTGALIGWEDDATPEPVPFRIDRPVTVRIEKVLDTERVQRPSWLVAADVESGDSGAALVDARGRVVGVAYATTRRNAGVAYATRASVLAEFLASSDTTVPVDVPGCARAVEAGGETGGY